MRDLPSGTVTFLFTDVEGSTRLLHDFGAEKYAAALEEHRRVLRAAFASHGGVEVDTQGDAFFVAFATAQGAMTAASEAQQALAEGPIRVRMGLHTGAPLLTNEGYIGVDVHQAARIAAAGHGGQVLVSEATRALVDASSLRDLGEHRLKDLLAPERLYQLGGATFPPLKTLYRTNLPLPATLFLGRERELQEVIALLERDDVMLLTLTGPGGTGKTRLALQAAAAVAERFPDGLTWVALSPLRDPALLLAAVAHALELREEPGRPLADSLVARLSGRRHLVLLDNAEHLLPQAADDVRRLSAASGLTLLVTSRERLQLQGEEVWAVPPLGEEDGVRLFTARARALDASFTTSSTVRELCGRLDNLPLALELAAARTPLFTPAQLLERMGQRLDLLKAGRDAEPRQQTLRATIAWSYDLLTEDEQELFQRLAVFVGGCTYEAAEMACEADPDTLQSLLDKSLLRRRDSELGPRYWMLETVREYALERLEVDESLEEACRAHADYYLALAESAERLLDSGEDAAWLGVVEPEHDNLRAALRFFSGSRLQLRLAAAIWRFWLDHGHLTEGRAWLRAALAHRTDAPIHDVSGALRGASALARLQGDIEEARRYAEESLLAARTAGDRAMESRALGTLANIALACREYERAAELHGEAETIFRELGDDRSLAVLTSNRSYLALEVEDFEHAFGLANDAVNLSREAGDRRNGLASLLNLAFAANALNKDGAARTAIVEAISLARELGHTEYLAIALMTAAALIVHREPSTAAALLDSSTAAALLDVAEQARDDLGLDLGPVEKNLLAFTEAAIADAVGEEGPVDQPGLSLDGAADLAVDTLTKSR